LDAGLGKFVHEGTNGLVADSNPKKIFCSKSELAVG
jgi:hypothetical protein